MELKVLKPGETLIINMPTTDKDRKFEPTTDELTEFQPTTDKWNLYSDPL